MSYSNSKNNKNKSDYNIDRLIKYLKSQKDYLKTHYIDPNKRYTPKFAPGVNEKLNSSKKDYSSRVHKLIKITLRCPREDDIVDTTLEAFTCKGFDVPEATHRRAGYDDKKNGYEVWSKDIDKENRLIYEIHDNEETILFLSIREHDLKEDTKLYSKSSSYFTTLMHQVISTRNKKEGNVSNQLKKLIEVAKKYGLVETTDYLIISDESGIDIYDKSNDEITHIEEADDGSTIYSKGK